jgi:bla regulator protein blaR1
MANRGPSLLKKVSAGAVICVTCALLWPRSSTPSPAQPSPQSQTPDWQVVAGGRMAFDTATVSQNTTAPPAARYFNFPLGPGDVYIPNGGNFRARNVPLVNYIVFAFKITPSQEEFLVSQLPKWATTDRFDITAKVEGNPTKDQMRLMVQALLADRFRLAAHHEIRQVPVFALLLDQSGSLGPLLQRHPEESPCPTTPMVPSPPPTAPPQAFDTRFPDTCGGIVGMTPSAPGRTRVGARNVLMELIATSIPGGDTGVERPVVNKTGLTGRYDFAIEFVPQDAPPAAKSRAEAAGPTFAEALKEQLGLKLESQTGPVDFLVIDFIDQLSPN